MKRKNASAFSPRAATARGLNAAIRGRWKAAPDANMEIIGFRDGFRGWREQHHPVGQARLAGILTIGGTVLGTGRDVRIAWKSMVTYVTCAM